MTVNFNTHPPLSERSKEQYTMTLTSFARTFFAMNLYYDSLTNVSNTSSWQLPDIIARDEQRTQLNQHHQMFRTMPRLHLWRHITKRLRRLCSSPIIFGWATPYKATCRLYCLSLWRPATQCHSNIGDWPIFIYKLSSTLLAVGLPHISAICLLRVINPASFRSHDAIHPWCTYPFITYLRL